jgi:hypothetical protein
MPPSPLPLDARQQAKYDELYLLLGKSDADTYAAGVSKPAPVVAAPVALPAAAPAPVTISLAPPVGMVPSPTPLPEPRQQLLDRPNLPTLQLDAEGLAQRAIEVRTIVKQREGKSFDEAKREATAEITRLRETPRTVEYGAPRAVPGASELAVRGEELLPRMGKTEVVLESIKPQVLETAQQAEGRRRFERAKADARARLGDEAKKKGISIQAQADLEAIDNNIRAGQIAQAQFGDKRTMDQIREIEAALNAPLYAAVDEFKGVPPGEVLSKYATDTLRGLTQEERYGRLVETRGAAALRNLGGLTRVGTEALRIPVDYLTSEAAAATAGVPGVTGATLRAEREAERAEGPARVRGPGVTYEPGFTERQRLETGDFVKDVAYQVSTGRSAIDDWYDAGVGKGAATVLGLATEIGLPLTPAGWATDVPKAFGAAKVVNAVGDAAAAAARAPRLQAFLSETASSATKLGFAMDKPSWWKTITDATDARVTTATRIAGELGDAAALERVTAKASKAGATADELDAVTEALETAARSGQRSNVMERVIAELDNAGIAYNDTRAVIDSGIIQRELSDIARNLGRTKPVGRGNVAPDILRNTYAAALKDTNKVGETSEAAVRAAIAETLEKVPDSGWSFVTPRLAVKKSTIASPKFQKAVAQAVKDASRANPDISVAEVQRVVEETIKREFRGTTEALAEPVAVAPPRAPQLLPEAPRGGLERIATPAPRQAALIEFAQDAKDTGRAIAAPVTKWLQGVLGNPVTRVSDTFAGSSFTAKLRGTLDDALTARIPVEMRDFIETTSSQINSLSSTVQGGAKSAAKGGPIINAIRTQGGLPEYLDARIFADVTDPQSLSVLDMPGAYAPGGVKPRLADMNDAQKAAAADAVERMARGFFGTEAIGQVLSPQFAKFITDTSRAAADTSDTAIDALALVIAESRRKYPVLGGRGRVSAGQDDIASAALEYIINNEAKVIWGKNFDTFFPGVADARVTVNDILDTYQSKLSAYGVSDATAAAALGVVRARLTGDRALQEAVEAAAFAATRNARVSGVIDFTNTAYGSSVWETALPDGIIDDLKAVTTNPFEESSVTAALLDAGALDREVGAMVQFATQNRIVRAVDEADVLQFVSNSMKLPITSTERKIIETLVGPIDDLAKGTGALADNLKAVYRNPRNGLGVSFTGMFQSAVDFLRSASRSGLTVGTILPNTKFHATNYLSAPFLMSMTSPGLALRAIASEFLPLLSDFGSTSPTWIKHTAQNPAVADNIAFTSATGIPYTYKQLDDYMSSNYFGMTQSVNDFGNQFADDVRIALGTAPSGKAAGLFQQGKDRMLQLWNINGTNYSTAFAAATDTSWRQNIFLAALKSGETPDAARKVATNATLDYGRIPGELRTAAARYMTFFSWFAVSNAEVFSALFRPKAIEAIARTAQAQRTFHRGWGEWDLADDDFKKSIFSVELGEYDDTRAFYTGFVNPSLDPLVNQASLLMSMPTLMTSGKDGLGMATDAGVGLAKSFIDQSFTPELGYLQELGLLGEGRKGLMVPWRQASWHQAQGPEHFAAWMADNGVTSVPVDERRLGEPTFYGQQYKYKDDAARNRAATLDAIQMFAGVGRMLNDYSSMGLIALPPDGVDMKRYDRMTLGILQYFSGGTLKKGSNEYELTRKAIEQTNRELRNISKEN